MNPRRVIILGSTGSIGRRALDVCRNNAETLKIVGLSTRSNGGLLADQVEEFRPEGVAFQQSGASSGLQFSEDYRPRVWSGNDANVDLVNHVEADLILVSTVGISGLRPTLAALKPGKQIALANKEVLVAGGPLVMSRARQLGVPILPVDSEHNAISQCLQGHRPEEVRKLILTASGGPFRTASLEAMAKAGPDQALQHPTWSMGSKITIDSATLMNKGFEVLEASHLFQVPLSTVHVVVHPGSTVHSLVEFIDGSILAQLGPKDMYLPIQNCLLHQVRRSTPVAPLDLLTCGPLEFSRPDTHRFPCLRLAYEAGQAGGVIPVILNGANEVAVERFLQNDLGFLDIPELVEQALASAREHLRHSSDELDPSPVPELESILRADQWARRQAHQWTTGQRSKLRK